jgi:hypothetical protein
MHRRKWAATSKALMAIEGLKGKPVVEICTAPQSSQRPYYPWRDQFVANAASAFEAQQYTRKAAPLEQEKARRKQLVGELTRERKNSDALLG